MQSKRFCFALDLKDDADLISQYEEYHRKVWPEIIESIKTAGIQELEIYRYHTRLFMIMEVDKTFSFERKTQLDLASEKVQEWEQLMWNYQQQLPLSKPGEKWMLMDKIFTL